MLSATRRLRKILRRAKQSQSRRCPRQENKTANIYVKLVIGIEGIGWCITEVHERR